MITKLGYVIGAGTGAIRGSSLTPEEKEAIKEYYGLARGSNLALRNAGRGILGEYGGGLLGLALGSATGNPGVAALGGLGGAITGAALATNKYSAGRAREILEENPDIKKKIMKLMKEKYS